MARCPHCGESIEDGQEHCYACGQHVRRRRAYQHERRVNPLVFVGAGLIVVLVLGGLLVLRNNAARKQAALLAELETLRVQDSTRRATREWQTMLQVAENDAEARSLTADLNDVESRFESVRMRAAEHPTVRQEDIISRFRAELRLLRQAVVVLASSADTEARSLRDSIRVGRRRAEDLTKELGRAP